MANLKTPPSSKKRVLTDNDPSQSRVAVAYSGGLDSTALLHATIAAHGVENVLAFHVNHGLQKQADRWLLHCAHQAQRMGVMFDFRLLELGSQQGVSKNIEALARQNRYQALFDMCATHQISNLLVAHHQDDQAETVMIQLLRGAGLAGLSAMPIWRDSGGKGVRIWRPFLDLSRREIESYAKEHHLEWIEDPSNTDERFTRNALRKRVMPLLEKIRPHAAENLSRTAAHLSSAQRLLECLADIDLQGMVVDGTLKVKPLLLLRADDPARASNAFRRWLQTQSLVMPSEERLNAWWTDLENASAQATIHWLHDGHDLRVWRGALMVSKLKTLAQMGGWVFEELDLGSVEAGLPLELFKQAMQAGKIQERTREGGEKFRVHAKRPRRTLKNLFQEANIPPWQREAPILYLGDEILAVVGIGMNADLTLDRGARVVARWSGE